MTTPSPDKITPAELCQLFQVPLWGFERLNKKALSLARAFRLGAKDSNPYRLIQS
jgi:hypothetical protein